MVVFTEDCWREEEDEEEEPDKFNATVSPDMV